MLIGPLLAAAFVVIVAGVAKIARPEGTASALRAAGLPGSRSVATLIGLGELALGSIVVVWAPPPAIALLGVVYVAFAAFAILLLRRQGSAASCGCFGVADAPVHPVHVLVNVATAVVVGATLAWPPMSITDTPIAVFAGAVVLAATVIMALTTLPQVLIAAEDVLADPAETAH